MEEQNQEKTNFTAELEKLNQAIDSLKKEIAFIKDDKAKNESRNPTIDIFKTLRGLKK